MLKCYKCKITVTNNREIEKLFSKDRNRSTGFSNLCKKCKGEKDRELNRKRQVDKYKPEEKRVKENLRSEAKRIYKGMYNSCKVLGCLEKAELHHLHYRDNTAVVPFCRQHHSDAHYQEHATIKCLENELIEKDKIITKLRECVEFYVIHKNHIDDHGEEEYCEHGAFRRMGKKARETLKELEGGE